MKRYCLGATLVIVGFLSTATADKYVLVMSKDDNKACQHLINIYNSQLDKYNEIKVDELPEFNWVKWEDAFNFKDTFKSMDLLMNLEFDWDDWKKRKKDNENNPEAYLKPGDTLYGEVTRFDMNNDGEDDTVSRTFGDYLLTSPQYPQASIISFSREGSDNGSISNGWSDALDELDIYLLKNLEVQDDRKRTYHNGYYKFRKIFRDAHFYPAKINNKFFIVRFGFYTDDVRKAVFRERKKFSESNMNVVYQFNQNSKQLAPNDPDLRYRRSKVANLVCIFMKKETPVYYDDGFGTPE